MQKRSSQFFALTTGLIACLILISSSSKHPPQTQVEVPEWLTSTWENKTDRGSIYESWTISGPKELAGLSYMIKDKDTVIFETVRLVEDQNTLFYIPTVMDQNEQQPVKFKLREYTDNELVFENKAHDFPQVIAYRLINADSLVAEISGEQDGELRGSRFTMSKVK
ncbi:MAG: DUF6265 family protein [Cyclobacteriaceae bacterium]